jgi:ATP-dependent DNA helicase PIF1
MLSFVSKMMNKLIGERDYSAQEIRRLRLKLLLQEDSRVVLSVDCRPQDKHTRPLDFSDEDEIVQEKQTTYEKYCNRPPSMEDVSYFEFLERWNFQARNPDNWKKWQSPAKPQVLYFFPRYKPLRGHRQFGDFCRVKLLLNHPHREHDELLTVNGQHFDNYILGYEYYSGNHEHEDDHYG